ncbi:MAG: cadherin-like domain-containing protein, partial [FCB group bacterium]|nr:cadherin-like domain-containing protein [FCB group bacterium]
MKIKILIILSCLVLVSTLFADQPSSDNYILIQRGFLTGNANQSSPPGSANYELTESSMLGIANDAETSAGYLNYPGFLQPNNHAPTIVLPDDFTFEEDDGIVVDFAPFINDINGDIVSLSVSGNTEVIVDIVDFTVTFSATLNWNGTETLNFTANDNMDRAVVIDDVDVIVTPVNDDPTIVLPDDFTFDEDDGLVIDFADFVDDVDLDVLTLTVAGNTEITVDIVDLQVTFGATANWNGTEILTFTVDDGQGERVSFTTGRKTSTKNEENNRAT